MAMSKIFEKYIKINNSKLVGSVVGAGLSIMLWFKYHDYARC